MKDLEIHLVDRPGALAALGEALGRAGVSIEGGGVFTHEGVGIAHYLVHDAPSAVQALRDAGIDVADVSDVVMLRLRQGVAGQLGMLARWMSDAGVNIRVQYSDHDNRLVLVVDDQVRANEVVRRWTALRDA